jgi:basic membrane protein A
VADAISRHIELLSAVAAMLVMKGSMVLAAVMMLSACTKDGDTIYQPDSDEPKASTAPLVTVIYNADALGDRSYNDLIFAGVEKTAREHGLRTLQMSPTSYEEGLAYLQTMFQTVSATKADTVRRLYIVCAAGYDEYIRQNAHLFAENPNADLLYLETPDPLPEGCGSTIYLPYYGAMYEAGALMPALEREALVVGSNPEDQTVAGAIKGFNDGFTTEYYSLYDPEEYSDEEYSEEEIAEMYEKKISTVYLADHAGEGYNVADTTLIKLLSLQIPGEEYIWGPVLIPVCGGSGSTLSYLMHVLEVNRFMGIDVDVLSEQSPMSCLKHIDRAVSLCIGQWLSPQGMPRHQVLGLNSGYTGVSLHFYYDIIEEGFNEKITDELRQQIHEDAIRKEEAYENN